MFNTDDKLIQGCMFLAGLIFFAYGAVMMFNTDFMMERYPTFENNQTRSRDSYKNYFYMRIYKISSCERR